eukprot:3962615-Pyramimonas_sp.AAC.1
MTVKARILGVSTLCRHASPSTMYIHPTAAEAECQGNKNRQPSVQQRVADMDHKVWCLTEHLGSGGGQEAASCFFSVCGR